MPLTLKPRPALAAFTFSLTSSPEPNAGDPSSSATINALANAPRPPADFIPEKDMYMFGTYPLLGAGEVGRGLIRCKRCRKVGLEWAAGEHRRICNHVLDGAPLTTKKTAKASKTTDSSKKRRASEVSETASASPTKKRVKVPVEPSVDEEDDEPLASYKGLKKSEIKKIQKDKARAEKREAKEKERMEIAERKRQRATNPINLDRQCGVINDKNIPCARSLTCKTHTVGAKRSVEGRTRPYDELYIEWQRAHNPNYKEPQKREKTEKEKKVAVASTSGPDGKAALKKKKFGLGRSGALGDEGLRDDEDGQRELEELVAITRLAGERVKNTFGRHGFGPITSARVVPPPAPGRQNSSGAGAGSGTGAPSKGGATSTNAVASTSKAPSAASSTTTTSSTGSLNSRNGNTIPFLSVWRSTTNEYTEVGSMLTKALAARVKPVHATQQKGGAANASGGTGGSGGAGAGAGGRVPLMMASGQGMPSSSSMTIPGIGPIPASMGQMPTNMNLPMQMQMPMPMPMSMNMNMGMGMGQGHPNAQAQAQAQQQAFAQAQALAHQSQMARQQLANGAAAVAGAGADSMGVPLGQQGMYGGVTA